MKRVQNAHNRERIKELHVAMVDLFAHMNLPQRDHALLNEAGVRLDRALFPLLVGIERFGPIGVGDLAARVGRDYTTVSRQVGKLVELRLIHSKPASRDRRINEASISPDGLKVAAALHRARYRMAQRILAKWSDRDLDEFVRLLRLFVDDLIGAASHDDRPAN